MPLKQTQPPHPRDRLPIPRVNVSANPVDSNRPIEPNLRPRWKESKNHTDSSLTYRSTNRQDSPASLSSPVSTIRTGTRGYQVDHLGKIGKGPILLGTSGQRIDSRLGKKPTRWMEVALFERFEIYGFPTFRPAPSRKTIAETCGPLPGWTDFVASREHTTDLSSAGIRQSLPFAFSIARKRLNR
jgi:hypothetical protein